MWQADLLGYCRLTVALVTNSIAADVKEQTESYQRDCTPQHTAHEAA
jgi:hypothetical protein